MGKPKHLPHKEWVMSQKLRKNFRDVLVHTALIESAIIKESIKKKAFSKKNDGSYRSFGKAIEILDKNKILDIFNLKERRNQLVHDIFSKRLNQDEIEKIRDEMFNLIHKIRKESELIKKYLAKMG